MAGPVVGISSYRECARWGVWDRTVDLLPSTYADAVRSAGGVPVLLPSLAGVEAAVDRLDALVLAGGADLDPGRYGAAAHPLLGDLRPDRDEAELALLTAALGRDLPVLAVCRGMQLLNVARGGTLVQHLPDTGVAAHDDGPGLFRGHRVQLDPDGPLAGAFGAGVQVSCHHHQAVDVLGAGVRPTGWADDGTVEAVTLDGARFVVGVQWHPEQSGQLAPFELLVSAAR